MFGGGLDSRRSRVTRLAVLVSCCGVSPVMKRRFNPLGSHASHVIRDAEMQRASFLDAVSYRLRGLGWALGSWTGTRGSTSSRKSCSKSSVLDISTANYIQSSSPRCPCSLTSIRRTRTEAHPGFSNSTRRSSGKCTTRNRRKRRIIPERLGSALVRPVPPLSRQRPALTILISIAMPAIPPLLTRMGGSSGRRKIW